MGRAEGFLSHFTYQRWLDNNSVFMNDDLNGKKYRRVNEVLLVGIVGQAPDVNLAFWVHAGTHLDTFLTFI